MKTPTYVCTKVAGVTYGNHQEVITRLHRENPVKLVREPQNVYDVNAIAVYALTENGVEQIGYIPKKLTAELAPLLDRSGAIATVIERRGGWGMYTIRGVVIEIILTNKPHAAVVWGAKWVSNAIARKWNMLADRFEGALK